MAVNLLEMLQGSLGPTLAREASRYLGESETATRSAVGAALPALLAGLAQQGSTSSGAAELFRTLTGSRIDTGFMNNLGGMLAGGDKSVLSLGGTLLSSLFGDRTGAMTSAISSISGMKSSSVSTLLALAAPAVLSFLKSYLLQNKLDVGGLASLLGGQREHLRSALDDRITSALGFASPSAFLSSLTAQATGAAERVGSGVTRVGAYAADTVDRIPAAVPVFRRPWFWGALAALALLAWVLMQNWPTTTRTAMKAVDLPGGRKVEVPAGGFLDSLTSYLKGGSITSPRSFTFDDLHFETGSATLTGASKTQLALLADILKAYPNVSVSVRGHTDNTGDPVANKKLSADRAAAVKDTLVAQGIGATQITSEGYGPEQPIASNDTEEGRARNRRVELVVLKG